MIILASASPARAHLLSQAGFRFEVVATNIDETVAKNQFTNPELLVKTLAQQKAQACRHQRADSNSATILAADTIVVCGEEIIGKPLDKQDAQRIICKLAGNTHFVWTGVCLLSSKGEIVFAEKTAVTLRPMTKQEIESYLDTNEWHGKAGGYQIQKTLGRYATKITGSYTNIIGLPMMRLVSHMRRFIC